MTELKSAFLYITTIITVKITPSHVESLSASFLGRVEQMRGARDIA
jgi:hypothetical protein